MDPVEALLSGAEAKAGMVEVLDGAPIAVLLYADKGGNWKISHCYATVSDLLCAAVVLDKEIRDQQRMSRIQRS